MNDATDGVLADDALDEAVLDDVAGDDLDFSEPLGRNELPKSRPSRCKVDGDAPRSAVEQPRQHPRADATLTPSDKEALAQ